jgi:hypothetical protein
MISDQIEQACHVPTSYVRRAFPSFPLILFFYTDQATYCFTDTFQRHSAGAGLVPISNAANPRVRMALHLYCRRSPAY